MAMQLFLRRAVGNIFCRSAVLASAPPRVAERSCSSAAALRHSGPIDSSQNCTISGSTTGALLLQFCFCCLRKYPGFHYLPLSGSSSCTSHAVQDIPSCNPSKINTLALAYHDFLYL